MWDPAVYRRFGNERSRPFFDLVARIGATAPRAVADLGCGPGELTRTLADRWPSATVTGVDSSPEMIDKATAADPAAVPSAGPSAGSAAVPATGPAAVPAVGAGRVTFRLGDIASWRPGPDTDVLVTNAALQWVPGHQEMLTRWATELPSGAWLAMQVPGNFDAPSHRLLRATATDFGVAHVLRESPVDDPADYAARLTATGATVDAWETTYLHLLPVAGPDHPVLRWIEGTALRPVRAALDEDTWPTFRTELAKKIAGAYPARGDLVPFPFRRIFVVARTA
ncbi:trans-aconitate 2-methyltransferase [Actinoplanes octamycinicus]|uniref:Trans-aconitate 2-methyltransferase n=1 Tax=Actinoplanes octamycinicus TaxID=135948 RepID=A0A7W7H7Z7_9ACTN|nr:trans-aconitate 2-methyltransferase [Actinoplanes octamycinicus]MBB4745559.1 trans-aconitate 2-methyltransferase [Actinoplanes octamycinicus]GIE56402.1 trans-aconitate 2-methyltransferase [Actinoplanes octamycinicus]